MKVELLDLGAQYASIKEEIGLAINRVLESQTFILGKEVSDFENAIASYLGCRYAIGVSSGTDALLVSLMALDVGPGDEVITTPFTFFGTAGAIARLGAKPVFVDIEEETFNIDVSRIEEAITPRTKAIIPVHLFGRCADMKTLMALADSRGIPVVEDVAQAIGASQGAAKAGSIGALGCFSFFPAKNLGCFGDGGLITSNDAELAEKCRVLRVHGSKPKYYHKVVGGNFRLDALQAAILSVKLPHIERWNSNRRRNAATYTDRLSDLAASGAVRLPVVPTDGDHVFNQYSILCDNRDGLAEHLSKQNIGNAIYYPLPLHLQECFKDLGYSPGSFPVSERCSQRILSIPVYPELGEREIGNVADTIRRFFE